MVINSIKLLLLLCLVLEVYNNFFIDESTDNYEWIVAILTPHVTIICSKFNINSKILINQT